MLLRDCPNFLLLQEQRLQQLLQLLLHTAGGRQTYSVVLAPGMLAAAAADSSAVDAGLTVAAAVLTPLAAIEKTRRRLQIKVGSNCFFLLVLFLSILLSPFLHLVLFLMLYALPLLFAAVCWLQADVPAAAFCFSS